MQANSFDASPIPWILDLSITHTSRKEIGHQNIQTFDLLHFFLPLDLLLAEAGAGLEATLEALDDGATDVDLLPATDLMFSSALFYFRVSS
jgi:hypothetical protein